MIRVLTDSRQALRKWRAALAVILVLITSSAAFATPAVTTTTPADGSSAVDPATTVQATFTQAINPIAVDSRHLTLSRQLKVVAVAAGAYHALAVRTDGTVASWRYSGTYIDERDNIPAGLSGVAAVAAGDNHSLALKNDGTVVAWGKNNYGQINVPADLAGVVAIAAGTNHSVALKKDGTVVTWGNNATSPSGLSGIKAVSAGGSITLALKNDGTLIGWGLDGTYNAYKSLSGTIPAGLTGVAAIAQGYWHGLALKCDGTVVAWGNNGFFQAVVPAGLTDVKGVAAGQFFSLALKSDGTVVSWGKDSSNRLISVVPEGLSDVVAIAGGRIFSVALKDDCTVAAWGGASPGFPVPESPMVPDEPSEVTSIAQGGTYTMVLRRDGNIATWGTNSYGQATVPAGLAGTVKALAAGHVHAMALKKDGTVAAWGDNRFGQTNVPGGLTGVKAIAAGTYHSVALKSDGTVVAWGRNDLGQTNVPTGLSGVIAIASQNDHSAALKSDGTVVMWGWNYYGQCNVPAGLTGVKAIATGTRHTIALKNDGTIVGWGDIGYGQATAPAGLTGVQEIIAGQYYSAALLNDGTVTWWGSVYPFGAYTAMPAGLNGVRSISGNWGNIAVVKSDNTVVIWGANNYGQAVVPYPYRNANIYENPVFGIVTYDADSKTATLSPLSQLEPGAYVAEVTGVRNLAEEPLLPPVLWKFTTIGYDAAAVCPCFAQPVYPTCGPASYTVTGTVAGGVGGTISCESPVNAGANSTCTVTPAYGYDLTALTDNNVSVMAKVSGNAYTLNQVQADHAVIATFRDVTPPVVTPPADVIIEANAVLTHITSEMIGSATATDAVGVTYLTSDFVEGDYPLGRIIVTWTAKDAAGNAGTATQSVTVVDTTPPVLTVPRDMTVEATGPQTFVNIGQASASDIFTPVEINNDAPVDRLFKVGTTTTIHWTAEDPHGLAASGSQEITVQDTTKPVVTPPDRITIEATGPLTDIRARIGSATATDAVGVVSITNDARESYPLGTYTITWTARDAAGNAGTAEQTVAVVDTTPPKLTVPKDISVILNTPLSAPAVQAFLHGATATDIASPPVTITFTTPVLTAVGDKVVTFTATDAVGLSSTGTATIHVIYGCGDTYLNDKPADFLTPVSLLKPFKLGSTIPVKLHLCDAAGVDVNSATARLFLQMLSNNEPVGDPIEVSSTSGADTGNYFRVVGSMYMYNLNTKPLAMGSYQIQVKLDDNSTWTLPLTLKQ